MKEKYLQNQALTNYSRSNRRKQTDAENKLWFHIKSKQLEGCKFRRQFPIDNYIVDFYCHERKLAIELDGSQHIENREYDERRTTKLKAYYGIRILRFWDNDVLMNIDGVLERVLLELTLLEKNSQT